MSIDIDPIGGDPTDQRPVTIDQIGIEHSRRYAQDQASLETKYIRDTGFVSSQSSITVSDATFVSIMQSLMGTRQRAVWASIEKPPAKSSLSLFTSSCIPSLGNQDQRDVKIDTLRVHLERFENEFAKKGASLPFEDRKVLSQKIHEAKALISIYEQIGELDTIKDAIFARLNQYHRG